MSMQTKEDFMRIFNNGLDNIGMMIHIVPKTLTFLIGRMFDLRQSLADAGVSSITEEPTIDTASTFQEIIKTAKTVSTISMIGSVLVRTDLTEEQKVSLQEMLADVGAVEVSLSDELVQAYVPEGMNFKEAATFHTTNLFGMVPTNLTDEQVQQLDSSMDKFFKRFEQDL